MKKFLLLAAAALVMTSAGAQQMKNLKKVDFNKPERVCVKQNVGSAMEVKMATPQEIAKKAPRKGGYIEPYYNRPAGMFHSPFISVDGAGLYSYGNYQFALAKPFAEYTFKGDGYGNDGSYNYVWEFYDRYSEDPYFQFGEQELVWTDFFAVDEAPIFYMVDGDIYDESSPIYQYQWCNYDMGGDDDNPVVNGTYPIEIATIPYSEMYDDDIEFLLSSKSMTDGGRFQNALGPITRFYGADPYGTNQYGWWFGKNGSHIDGMAQVFEKPTVPYMLKNVYLQAYTDMEVKAPVKMTCKVYKLEEVPDYVEDGGVRLPLVPGELVVTGEATVTPTTGEDKNGLVTFTLYGQDEDDPELTYEYTPTIDYPIMVCIDGYNDPEMEDLVNFSAFISTDWNVDEGFGELAYLKYPIYEIEYDENGDTIFDAQGEPEVYFTGEYYWRGLNNFFSGPMEMKTGLTIFIAIENPFLTFYWNPSGEYTFPNEGGVMEETIQYSDTTVVSRSIDFFCSLPVEDGDWYMTWNGSDELPDWLDIELQDVETYETGTIVNAVVTAQPLPEGVSYRSAVIRFEIPGDYVEYKFKQGVSGIEEQLVDKSENVVPVGYYDVMGRQHDGMQPGINIIKMSDGSAKKVIK
ncbi:MAG: hypothetical protein IKZ92_08710 [Muribaculaceae bacterium]|nr:hypothetical protein [Muribaculaceae bacterium]